MKWWDCNKSKTKKPQVFLTSRISKKRFEIKQAYYAYAFASWLHQLKSLSINFPGLAKTQDLRRTRCEYCIGLLYSTYFVRLGAAPIANELLHLSYVIIFPVIIHQGSYIIKQNRMMYNTKVPSPPPTQLLRNKSK